MPKNRPFLILIFLFSFLFSQEANIITTSPEEITGLFAQKFDQLKSMEMSFREYFKGSVRRGKISFMKPHFLKVLYLNSDGTSSQEIYVNDTKLFVYLKKLNIVCEQDLAEEEEKEFFDEKIINVDRLLKLYNFNFIESKNMVPVLSKEDHHRFKFNFVNNAEGYRFELTPKDKTQGLDTIEIWIDKNGLVRRCRSKTIENRTLDLFFYEIKANRIQSENVFFFETPANARIIKNNLIDLESLSEEEPTN